MTSELLKEAVYKGFDCAECGYRRPVGFTPIRDNENGPFFCSFLCAWDYRAARGDVRAAGQAAKLRGIRAGIR